MKRRSDTVVVIDAGNTNTHIGVFHGELLAEKIVVPSASAARKFEEALGRHAAKGSSAFVVGSVVPRVTRILEVVCHELAGEKPLLVDYRLPLGIRVTYRHPEKLGADRIANVIGGFSRYGGPLLVVGFGTAITFDLVNRRGDFTGGAIAPGLSTMYASLHEKTAQLPRVDGGALKKGQVGHDTRTAIEFGIAHGADGAIKEIVKNLKSSCGAKVRLKLVATGGDAEYFAKRLSMFDYVDPDLTLYGLREIFQRVADYNRL
ncbi:MAG TPA: type III pantothenate kinase [bacterium]|nr:type III pantothenate kinase [bacterium]